MRKDSARRILVASLLALAVMIPAVPGAAGEIDMQTTDDSGPTEFGPIGSQCSIGICLDLTAPFSDSNGNGVADPLVGGGSKDWPGGGWSLGLCCNGHQKLEIQQTANNGPSGASDCRDSPVIDLHGVGCKAGGDVGMGKAYAVNSVGQVYSATAWVKLVGVHEPEPGMFRARLTIHGYDGSNTLQQECNAFLRSSEVDGPDGNPLPGTADQTLVYVPIVIPTCEMVDAGPGGGGIGNVITSVDVTVRANNFKNDIAYGEVRVERLIFVRLS